MITIDNKNFQESKCVGRKNKSTIRNQSWDGSLHGYTQGYFNEWEIELQQITKEDKEFLEDLGKFLLVDNEGKKAYCRIFDNINIDNKFFYQNEFYYNVSFKAEEVIT